MLAFTNGNPGTWTGVSGTGNLLATTQGYMLYVRGDRGVVPSGRFILSIVYHPAHQRPPLSRHSASSEPAGENGLMGNLYAAPIDFTQLVRSGVTSFKVWDPKLQGSYNVGGNQTFSQSNGYDPIPGGGSYGSTANTRIESGMAFLVNSANRGSIQLMETAKSTGSRNVFRMAQLIQQLKTKLFAQTSDGWQLADGNVVVFDENADNGIDNADAFKAKNFGENLAIQTQGALLTFFSRGLVSHKETKAATGQRVL